jgi:hypothetical protein
MRLLLFILILSFNFVTTGFSEEFPDGTVVVWENGNYLGIIQRHTRSNKTHAGIILYDGPQAYVYEASAPDVHRYTIETYYQILDQNKKRFPKLGVYFLKPSKPYSPAQLAAMKRYANAKLGTPFSIRSYMTGKPTGNTLHCCEYVGNILSQSGRYTSLGPKETPQTIFEKASKL